MVKLATNKNEANSVSGHLENDTNGSGLGLRNVVWAALEKIGGKEKQPEELPQGTSHQISLQISGEIDDQPFQQTVNSIVNVGFEQIKSSSVTPQVPELIGYILSKLNRVTRNRILTDIPEEFVANDNQLPATRPVLVEEAKHLLKRLRTSKQVKACGAVRCDYTL